MEKKHKFNIYYILKTVRVDSDLSAKLVGENDVGTRFSEKRKTE